MRCIVCMSELVPQNKIDAIRGFGAEGRIVGRSQDDAQVEAERSTAWTPFPPGANRATGSLERVRSRGVGRAARDRPAGGTPAITIP